MFNQDSRNGFSAFNAVGAHGLNAPQTPYYGQPYANNYNAPYAAPYAAYSTAPGYTGYGPYTGFGAQPAYAHDVHALALRLEEMRAQVSALTEIVRFEAARTGGLNVARHEANPIRVRESDSHLFLDICLPHLSMGDVELEVSGNRIICRTRVPVSTANRTWANQPAPRGFEVFELADGRVEFSWIAPVLFQAKEVEATWREGFLAVCIPKAEAAQRHTVKIVKDNAIGRKASGDMNS